MGDLGRQSYGCERTALDAQRTATGSSVGLGTPLRSEATAGLVAADHADDPQIGLDGVPIVGGDADFAAADCEVPTVPATFVTRRIRATGPASAGASPPGTPDVGSVAARTLTMAPDDLLDLGDGEAPALLDGGLGRYGDLVGVGEDVQHHGSRRGQRGTDDVIQVRGIRDAYSRPRPIAVVTAAKSGLSRTVPNSGSPDCSCSSFTIPSRRLSKTTRVTGSS